MGRNRFNFRILIPVMIVFVFVAWVIFRPEKADSNMEFFHRITSIKPPGDFTTIESFDNGEWLTGFVMKGDSSQLIQFARTHQFDSASNTSIPPLLLNSYSKENTPQNFYASKIYFINRSKDKHHWACLIDPVAGKFWGGLSYPDAGGN